MGECSIPGCEKPVEARGWCNKHYWRWRRNGDPLAGRASVASATETMAGEARGYYERIVLNHDIDACLIWPFNRNRHGYGRLRVGKRMKVVARMVCEHRHGPPPSPEHEAAHSCGQGHEGCVARAHLSWATHAQNMADTLQHGTHNRGERDGQAKLTEADVRVIRTLHPGLAKKAIARRYGVHPRTIIRILDGTSWAWLAEPDPQHSAIAQAP